MSIATKHGDGGQTGLAGGIRISKADLRVEAYGSVDELNTVLGFARSICSSVPRSPEITASAAASNSATGEFARCNPSTCFLNFSQLSNPWERAKIGRAHV